jgi:hypothetical protein
MTLLQYDIFSGLPHKNAKWLESVEGLDAAREKMLERAARQPGPYFVFCVEAYAVLASTNTSSAH